MMKAKRGRYTLEFKQEAARLVESGQSQASVARSLGVVEQTLGNWVREHRAGTLKGATSKPLVTSDQMEISRLRAELARVPMTRSTMSAAAIVGKQEHQVSPDAQYAEVATAAHLAQCAVPARYVHFASPFLKDTGKGSSLTHAQRSRTRARLRSIRQEEERLIGLGR